MTHSLAGSFGLSIVLLALNSACGGATSNDPAEGGAGAPSGGATTLETSGGTTGTGGLSSAGGSKGVGGEGTGGAGGAGTGGAGTGGSGGTTTMPNECRLTNAPTSTRPSAVTFQLVNGASTARYLAPDFLCGTGVRIYSCADGYTKVQSSSAGCRVDCSQNTLGCIACGACPMDATVVAAGASRESGWGGSFFTFGTTSAGCPCYSGSLAPSGKYRAAVTVYESAASAEARDTTGREVVVDFEYPDEDGVITLPIGG